MSRMRIDVAHLKEDLLSGVVSAYARYLERVPGAFGVVRAGGICEGKVSIVIGGGSGHYPAFAGFVGDGLADAAVVGDVFASPSAEQVYRVSLAADGGAGVLFSFGNYSGDRLNFGIAQEKLRVRGIDCRTVLVTDDVASAAVDDTGRRRGIAGDLCVFKVAGAAAAEGAGLDEVERVARKANSATRSLGVAFAGCTIPGQAKPLFEVTEGSYELGLGVHGEPGVRTVATMETGELAEALVMPLMHEAPGWADGRVAAVLNGLGSTTYEELFVLWSKVGPLLAQLGLTLVLPEVGEFVTSLDMAGCSLTLCWLDDELERLWSAPADTPAFRRGGVSASRSFPRRVAKANKSSCGSRLAGPPASQRSQRAADTARYALQAMLHVVEQNEERLGRLDAAAGDGDHGSGMVRGLRAAVAAADDTSTSGGLGSALQAAAEAFADQAGGTSGALWGLLLGAAAADLGDDEVPTSERVVAVMRRATEVLARAGGASVGDKSMLDALVPFVEELTRGVAATSFAEAWQHAARAAREAAEATAELWPRVGRAVPLGERSVGTPDAGAVSMSLCLVAVGEVLAAASQRDNLEIV